MEERAENEGEKAERVGKAINLIVKGFNLVTVEDLEEFTRVINRRSTFLPFTDPTQYRYEADPLHKMDKALSAMVTFKKEVSGIGYFK